MTPHPSTHADSDNRRKAVLFCPDCGHESGVTGDWLVRDRDGHAVYECPDCGTVVTKRGPADVRARRRSGAGLCADD